MNKEKLRKLRTLKATPGIIRRAKGDLPETEKEKYGTRVSRKGTYAFYLRCQTLSGFIKLAFFLPSEITKGNVNPVFEIFFNPEAEKWIARSWNDKKEVWSEAMLFNMPLPHEIGNLKWVNWSGFYSYLRGYEKECWINPDGEKTLKRELNGRGKAASKLITVIQSWQQEVRKKERQEKIRKETASWDDDMQLFREPDKRFIQWAQKEVVEQFIFYRSGEKKGYCTHCRKIVPLSRTKHKEEIKCPACRKQVTMEAVGKMPTTLYTGRAYANLIKKTEDGFTVTEVEFSARYKKGDLIEKKPYTHQMELEREIISGKEYKRYYWGLYRNDYHRWVPGLGICWRGEEDIYYTGNQKELTEIFKKSGALQLIQSGKNINLPYYLDMERKYPVLESLVKIGLCDIVIDRIKSPDTLSSSSMKNTEATKALEIDGSRLKRLLPMKNHVYAVEWLRHEKRNNTQYPDAFIDFMSTQEVFPCEVKCFTDRMGYIKIWHYLKKQMELTGETASQLIITWKDYLNMAQKNHLRTELEQIYKPKNLRTAHTEMVELGRQKDIEKQAAGIRKRYKSLEKNLKELEKYEYESGGYAIVAPRRVNDIILEGLILKHCIHTCDFYFERINTKESFILFLRRSESIKSPWYTLEVEPSGNIRQKRTTGDNQNDDLKVAYPFLKKWQKVIQKRMTAEDKKLAKVSDEKRKANYKNIRENRKIVWHGKHQGELLADVLEADFMAAI